MAELGLHRIRAARPRNCGSSGSFSQRRSLGVKRHETTDFCTGAHRRIGNGNRRGADSGAGSVGRLGLGSGRVRAWRTRRRSYSQFCLRLPRLLRLSGLFVRVRLSRLWLWLPSLFLRVRLSCLQILCVRSSALRSPTRYNSSIPLALRLVSHGLTPAKATRLGSRVAFWL